MTAAGSDTRSAELDARYGRTPGFRARNRLLLIVGACLMVLVFTAWVFWAGWDNEKANLESLTVGHRVVDDSLVTVTWQVSVAQGTEVSCALQAQNDAHGIVGWKIVELPPSTTFTRQYQEDVRTTQAAVTGLIYRCWLT